MRIELGCEIACVRHEVMLLSSVCCGVVGVSLGGMYMFVMRNVLFLVA